MRNISNFIEQLERTKNTFSIWVYSSKDHYCQFSTQIDKKYTSQLQEAIEQRLQVIIKMHKNADDGAFLLIPEVHAVVPVNFHDGQILSLNIMQAA